MLPEARTLYRKAVSLPALQERNFLWDKDAELSWRQYLGEHRPDVVLAQYGPTGLAAMPGCRDRGIPLVVHFHGYDASRMMRLAGYRRALGGLFQQAHAVVCASTYVQRILQGQAAPPRSCT